MSTTRIVLLTLWTEAFLFTIGGSLYAICC